MNRARICAALGPAAIVIPLAACSSVASNAPNSAAAQTSDNDASAGDGRANADGGSSGTEDATADAANVDLSCLGESEPLTLSEGLPFTSVSVGSPAASGAFLIDFATTRSTIDLGALPSVSSQATGCDPAVLGEACTFSAFDFFGPWGPVVLVTDDESGFDGAVREAGIVGTDFLSDVAITLDFAGSIAHRANAGTLCSDATLSAGGFVALSTAGFFANDTSTLEPLTDVASSAAPGTAVPNVPTVPFRIAGARAIAQLDSGFADTLVPHSVNVNVAYYNAINAASPGALVRDAAKDLSLSTCAGVAEPVLAYDLAAGASVALVDVNGTDRGASTSATIFVKQTPAAAASCGGIGTWSAPAAQIGASFYADARVLVLDPFTSRVWVKE